MRLGVQTPPPMPIARPPTHPAPTKPFDLTDRRLAAAMNVAVFTPYAIYLARGKPPPTWLIVASLAWTALQFADDMRYLVRGDAATMAGAPPCGCAGVQTPAADVFHRYRVNR